jgi:hypothetical protein
MTKKMLPVIAALFVVGLLCSIGVAETRAPENVFSAELVKFPGAWSFQLGKAGIILVRDEELDALTDPDKPVNISVTFDHVEKSLRQICEEAKAGGVRTLIIAFDQFFKQYRPGQDTPRAYMPDSDAYIEKIAKISKFADSYGIGLELSLLSPLEIGPGYRVATGESGMWMHYRKGQRDPGSGKYSVDLWRQNHWVNNKGPIDVEDAGVRVFAFKETVVSGTPYRAVDPKSIVEISDTAHVEAFDGIATKVASKIRVYGEGRADIGPLDRVLIVQQYRTPEMDYFSDNAAPFLKNLIDKYAAAGVKLNGLYADEMHIQQDWAYTGHHDNGEFALRYVSPGFAKRFAEKFGAEYGDFAKYLVYFVHGQEDFAPDLNAKQGIMETFGSSTQDVRATELFRSRYYKMLQNGVVDLFTEAKHYAENKMGHRLESRAHATWAESPTIDSWNVGQESSQRHQYEYTSNFIWSDTVHQSSAACSDYFKWGDFLTGNGNDHAEGGWLDRNYYALALACSTGILNEIPCSYCAYWGVPDAIGQRRQALVNAYGDAAPPSYAMVEGMEHRDVSVLMLYPLDLVAAEERFGSWMTQYGYANYITPDKLLERGKVVDGALIVAGRRFTTLATLFEPFPSKELLDMMRAFAENGGRLIWSGPPPVLDANGGDALTPWRDMFGVDFEPRQIEGRLAPGTQVTFEGPLATVAPQTILTDFLVDHIYPVTPREGVATTARVKENIVGTHRALGAGTATFLGYRPRDDQAKSLGYETRNWFETLDVLGAYSPTGAFPDVNDNTEHLSRTTPYLTCKFPNGCVAIAPHFFETEEDWGGGFARKQEEDKAYMDKHPLPSDALNLTDFKVNGHNVTYNGNQCVAFRVDGQKNLMAFSGCGGTKIMIDGRETVFADAPFAQVAWAPVEEKRRVPGGAVVQAQACGTGVLRIPAATFPEGLEFVAQGAQPGSRGETVSSRVENGAYVLDITPEVSGRWIYGVPGQGVK